MLRPLAYLAHPITVGRPTVLHNVADATRAFHYLHGLGVTAQCPGWTVLVAFALPGMSYEDWMAHALSLVAHSDVLIRLPGQSSGADREVAWAEKLGIPVVASEALGWQQLCDEAVALLRARGKL
jgi:hypothetical protein